MSKHRAVLLQFDGPTVWDEPCAHLRRAVRAARKRADLELIALEVIDAYETAQIHINNLESIIDERQDRFEFSY